MAKRFNIVNSSVTITDTISGTIEKHFKLSDTWYNPVDLLSNVVTLTDVSANNQNAGLFSANVSDCVDGDNADAVFDQSTFRTYMSANFSTAGGGSSAWDNIDGTPATQDSTDINYNAGNVGIGLAVSTVPAAKLDILGDGGDILKTENSTGQLLLQINDAGSVWSNGIIDDDTNTVMGKDAGIAEVFTTGYFGFGKFNTYFGHQAAFKNTIGQQNTFVGALAGLSNTTGFRNTCFGNFADVPQDGDGNDNITIGVQTGLPILDGDRNLIIGNTILGFSNALDVVRDAIFIGDNVNALGNTGTGGNTSLNEIVIGSGAVGNGSNTATYGNNSITNSYIKGVLNIGTLPISSAGLNTGDVWNDLGTLKVA